MLYGDNKIEMDTTRGHMKNSFKYTQHTCQTHFRYDPTP